nr:hypothetical protein [Tanacetum cinerariifolium]
VILVSSASGSMSQDNTKENRIRRTQSKAKKNKVEDHLRTVKSSLNKKSVVDSKATSSVLNSVSNVNFDLKCASCNGCLFSDNHDACVVDYIKYVNARRTFKLVGNVCPLTKIATPTIVPPREPIPIVNSMDKPVVTLVYTRKPKAANKKVPNKLKPNHSWGSSSSNVPSSLLTCRLSKSSSGTWTPIMGYGDYQIGNVTISHVYYMEGLGNNLFSIRQFCDSDLEVAFRQHTCFIRNLDGVDLLTGLVRGIPKLKFEKDHFCSACAMGKSTKKTHKPKSEDTNQEKLYLLHIDLCGPMRVESVNGKKYILVRLNVSAQCIRTDNGTEFVNQTLRDYYEEVGISHETSVARSLQQNGVVERRNRTLIKAARTMLIYTQAPLFLWAEAMATACFTQNRSIIRLRHGKTPYELLHSKLPDLSFFHVFGALCYPTNDSENLAAGVIAPIAEVIPQVDTDSTVILQDVGNDNLDMKVTHMGNDPLLGVPILEVTSDQSSSTASPQSNVVQIVLWYLDFGCSKHMIGDLSQLINFVQKFLGTVKFGNDHVAKIMGYGNHQIRNVTISRVYYVEGLGHNLFSIGQFCDLDLEVAFRQHTCFIRNLEGVDLLIGIQDQVLALASSIVTFELWCYQ